ncbi:MAG: hypothetical protein WBE58_14510, partial [Verrucomicrobiales bacterium]
RIHRETCAKSDTLLGNPFFFLSTSFPPRARRWREETEGVQGHRGRVLADLVVRVNDFQGEIGFF